MRIVLDVGGHYGELPALDRRWGFSKIYSFAPARACLNLLRGFRDARLTVVPTGLSNKRRSATLNGSGLPASVCADTGQSGTHLEKETIVLGRATDWLVANTSAADEIYLKLNCAGCECDVPEDVLDSGAIDRVQSIYVDFDVRKITSEVHRQGSVEQRLRDQHRHFVTLDVLTSHAGSASVRGWLERVSPQRHAGPGALRYRLGLHRLPYAWAVSVARAALPGLMYTQAARRLGTQARKRSKAHSGWSAPGGTTVAIRRERREQ